jgi:AcrR family transcriptional regulator
LRPNLRQIEDSMARKSGSSGPKTEKAIRAAGLKLIHAHGYEGMSLRQLAAEVGLQQGSLYNHIRTKQDLLADLLRAHMLDLLQELDAALAGIGTPLARLRAFIAFHLHYHMTRQAEVFVINFELRSLEPEHYAEIIALRQRYETCLAEILGAGMRDKSLRRADVQVASYALLAMLTGICTWYKPEGRLSEKEIITIHTDLILRGLANETSKAVRAKPAS